MLKTVDKGHNCGSSGSNGGTGKINKNQENKNSGGKNEVEDSNGFQGNPSNKNNGNKSHLKSCSGVVNCNGTGSGNSMAAKDLLYNEITPKDEVSNTM